MTEQYNLPPTAPVLTEADVQQLIQSALLSVRQGTFGNLKISGNSFTNLNDDNLLFGLNTGAALTTGTNNTLLGKNAGAAITTGADNILLGTRAGDAITTGVENVVMGVDAGGALTTGARNVFAGFNAGFSTTTGSHNVAIGRLALNLNTTGNSNVAIGQGALQSSTVNALSTAIGNNALNSTTTGDSNTAVGASALANNITGTNNTAVGISALLDCDGSSNVGLGNSAGSNITTGSANIILGRSSRASSATASNEFTAGSLSYPITNVYFGSGALTDPASAYTINGSGGSGLNIAGAALQLAGGRATGNAVGGSIIFQTSDAGVSGTTLQALATKMTLTALGNFGIGTSTFGTSAVTVFSIANGTAPTTGPADTVQFYSTDIAAGHTEPSFFCEGTQVLATGQADSASSVRVKMRINGTEVTLLAI